MGQDCGCNCSQPVVEQEEILQIQQSNLSNTIDKAYGGQNQNDQTYIKQNGASKPQAPILHQQQQNAYYQESTYQSEFIYAASENKQNQRVADGHQTIDKQNSETYELDTESLKQKCETQARSIQMAEVMESVSPRTGAKYTGFVDENGERQSWGMQCWLDGGRYEGEWQNSAACGLGKFWHADGDMYEGEWREDKANGFGKYMHADGAYYIGHWVDDMQCGKGKERWTDGSSFQGEYKEGKKHGQGTYKWADGSTFTGDWADNKINGSGEYRWPDGRCFIGEWKDNYMHGQGVYTWPDGRRYEGQYQNDRKHGQGVYTWSDNRQYSGQWDNGKQHGFGMYKSGKEGNEWRSGVWDNGKRSKWCD